jgi:mono/diheme cytochrome c family protein
MSAIQRRLLRTFIALLVIGFVLALLAYEVVNLDWDTFMENQVSVSYDEPPLRLPPEGAIAMSRPGAAGQTENPIPADDISLQRGQVLFDATCAVCHGATGQGDGSVVPFFRDGARLPPSLTDPRIAAYPDSTLYLIIHQGFGAMPPIRENLDERSHWDVINYLRTLQPQ